MDDAPIGESDVTRFAARALDGDLEGVENVRVDLDEFGELPERGEIREGTTRGMNSQSGSSVPFSSPRRAPRRDHHGVIDRRAESRARLGVAIHAEARPTRSSTERVSGYILKLCSAWLSEIRASARFELWRSSAR